MLMLIMRKYRFDGLADGNHTLTVNSVNLNNSIVMGLDFAVVSRYSMSTNGTQHSPDAQPLQPSHRTAHVSPGSLAGIIVSAVLGQLAFVGMAVYLFRRRRIARLKKQSVDAVMVWGRPPGLPYLAIP
jgi:hypothetical protein